MALEFGTFLLLDPVRVNQLLTMISYRLLEVETVKIALITNYFTFIKEILQKEENLNISNYDFT